MPGPVRRQPPVDPMNLRSMLMLDVARDMMLEPTWAQKSLSVSLVDAANPDQRGLTFLGMNHFDGIADVDAGRVDVAVLNPMVMLTMARLGTGPFTTPMDLSTTAVLPHHDQLAFAVSDRTQITDLAEIGERRCPLRVSVRGSLDDVTSRSVDVVLGVYGFSLADIVAWGGAVHHDQPMPNHPSRLGRLANGEIDAIFEEGTIIWADDLRGAGASVLPIDDEHLAALQRLGFRRGVLDVATYPTLEADVQTVDYSGWPIFCRTDADDALVEQFCRSLEHAKDRIVWSIGPAQQPPLPLGSMVTESPATPFDVPLHPAATAYWRSVGYLS
jgi:TRAP-type uncharacterized transport system substrate-binding protein